VLGADDRAQAFEKLRVQHMGSLAEEGRGSGGLEGHPGDDVAEECAEEEC
jgi:hypothetical protein